MEGEGRERKKKHPSIPAYALHRKLLYNFVDRSLRQAVPNLLQHFLEFDGRLRLSMTLVIVSNLAPSYGITRGFRTGEFGVHWSFIR